MIDRQAAPQKPAPSVLLQRSEMHDAARLGNAAKLQELLAVCTQHFDTARHPLSFGTRADLDTLITVGHHECETQMLCAQMLCVSEIPLKYGSKLNNQPCW